MKTLFPLALATIVLVVMAVPGTALVFNFEKRYAGGGAGPVTFRGEHHNQAGVTCNDCHPDAFVMIRAASEGMTMQEIKDGKYCGACHNGETAFDANDEKYCSRCHVEE